MTNAITDFTRVMLNCNKEPYTSFQGELPDYVAQFFITLLQNESWKMQMACSVISSVNCDRKCEKC